MGNGKPGVMIYFETAKAIKNLDDATVGQLFKAIMEYAEDGVIPEFEGVLAAVWPFVADKIERDNERYEKIREKRAEAGRKGGKARASNGKQNQANEANASFDKQIKPTATETTTATPAANANANADATAKREGKPTPTRHKYGEYSNVLLSDEELSKLKAEFPQDWKNRIERLSEYIASTGKPYKSHLATIRAWSKKDKLEKGQGFSKAGGDWCEGITPEDHANDIELPY